MKGQPISVSDVMDVIFVLSILKNSYGIDTDYTSNANPLCVRDYGVIADGINEDWSCYSIADRIAEDNGWKRIDNNT
jgi:hypothetical protein